jgi:hypothetical protein
MRRSLVMASLCLAVLGLAPIATAGATATGRCTFHGSAALLEELTSKPKHIKYSFASSKGGPLNLPADGVVCEEAGGATLTGRTTAEGEGEVSCSAGIGGLKEVEPVLLGKSGPPGQGKLELELNPATGKYEKVFEYELSVVSQAGIVDILVRPKGTATYTVEGYASFLESKSEPLEKCFTVGAGQLEFDAVAEGEI